MVGPLCPIIIFSHAIGVAVWKAMSVNGLSVHHFGPDINIGYDCNDGSQMMKPLDFFDHLIFPLPLTQQVNYSVKHVYQMDWHKLWYSNSWFPDDHQVKFEFVQYFDL